MSRDRVKNILIKYALLFLAFLISAIYYNALLKPSKIVSGGIGGIATILHYTLGIDAPLFIFLFSATLLCISFAFLGTKKSIAALFATIVYPILVKLTEGASLFISLEKQDILVAALFAGLLSGLTNGMVFKIGYSTGGLNIISQILYKYRKISISLSGMIISILIVATGGFFFGINTVLYAIIYIYVSRIVTDRVLLGISSEKLVYVVSKKTKEIQRVLNEELGHGITVFDNEGGLLSIKQKMIMTAVETSRYFEVKNIIKEIDKKAFIVITDSYEVKGGPRKKNILDRD